MSIDELRPLVVTTAEDLAKDVPVMAPMNVERVEVPPEPVLAPQIGFWETIQALVSLKADQAIVDGLDGKPMSLTSINPLAIAGIGSKFWKVIAAILFAGLVVLIGWQYLKSKIQKSA